MSFLKTFSLDTELWKKIQDCFCGLKPLSQSIHVVSALLISSVNVILLN